MRVGKSGRVGVVVTAVAVAGCMAAPGAHAGVIASQASVIKGAKVGKYRVTPSAASSFAVAEYSKGGSQVRYQGEGTSNNVRHAEGTFGDFGKIDMTFHKSGPFKKQKLPKGCHGKRSQKQKGTWKGVFKVDGEGRLPKVRKTKLAGSIIKFGDFECDGNFPTQVSLNTQNFGPGAVSFSATVRKSGGKPGFSANTFAEKRGAQISRSTFYRGKPSEFTYSSNYNSATVKPKGLFTGTGHYEVNQGRGDSLTFGMLTGNLKVKFLGEGGKSTVPSPTAATLGENGIFRPRP